MAAVTITTDSPGYRAGPTTRPPPARPDVTSRLPAPATRRRAARDALLVIVMAQAGVALGGSALAAPERRPAVLDHTIRPPGRLAVVRRAAPGAGEDPRPVVDALAQARHGEPLAARRDVEWGG